jgi:hypothetical protein
MRNDVFADECGDGSYRKPVFALTSYAGHASAFLLRGAPREARRAKRGGARRDRTDDLMLAKHALSQLSYGPVGRNNDARGRPSGFAGHTSLRLPAWLRHA